MVKKDIVLETLQEIARRNSGQITPEGVVEEARPEDSPIHGNFQWDDTEAAREYRLWQARQLITYKFKIEGTKEQQFYSIRTIVNEVPVHGYFTKEKILSEKEMYLGLLRDAVSEIKYWEQKYKDIKELEGIVNNDKVKEIEDGLV